MTQSATINVFLPFRVASYILSYTLPLELIYQTACGLTRTSRICQTPYFTFTTYSLGSSGLDKHYLNIPAQRDPKLTSIFLSPRSRPKSCHQAMRVLQRQIWMAGEY